jgi:geranylgeranyl pyrophosphate synthase
MILLYPLLSDSEKQRFDSIFGNESLSSADVEYVRTLIHRHGIDKSLEKTEREYSQKAKTALSRLLSTIPGLNQHAAAVLKDFVEYSLARTN